MATSLAHNRGPQIVWKQDNSYLKPDSQTETLSPVIVQPLKKRK